MATQHVYLVRHGQTALNAEGRLRGHEDPELDEVGLGQAAALGHHFDGTELRWVASSPLRRARQTAAAIAGPHDLEPVVDADFQDRDYGRWAGARTSEVVSRFGSVDAAPGVEAWPAFRDRIAARFVELVAAMPAGPALVVGHDAVNRAIFEQLFGLDPRTTPQRTGCWNELSRLGGRWQLDQLDQLPPAAAAG